MKKTSIALIAAALVCAGCSSISGQRTVTDPQGNTHNLTVNTHRFLWSSEGVDASTKDKDGFEFSLKVSKSNPNVDAIKAIAEGAVQGAVKGAK